jgi:hypothetical protein
MLPLAQIRYPVMMRLRKETKETLEKLAREQGLRAGPFSTHVIETIAKCPPEKFHAALAEFIRESQRR